MAGRRRDLSPAPTSGVTGPGSSNASNGPRRQVVSRLDSNRTSSTSKSRRPPSSKSKNDFNPRLIFSQIIALQCFHYLILGLIIQFNHVVFSTTVTIDRIFTDKFLNVWSVKGWADNSAILLSYIAGAVLLATIVEKSKKCLDFSATLFLINLTVCTLYGRLPATWDWWIIHILGTIVMILLGEYLCSRRELSDIPLLGS